MQDWRDGQLRYLVHFDNGGSGMRMRDEPLDVGCELDDAGVSYQVVRAEQSPHGRSFGHAWAELAEY